MDSISQSEGQSLSNAHEITALRAQIKANAALVFWKRNPSESLNSEVGIMAAGTEGYKAVLSIPKLPWGWSVAARGEARNTVVGALQSLLDVTAAALAEYEGKVLSNPNNPREISGGIIDKRTVEGGVLLGVTVVAMVCCAAALVSVRSYQGRGLFTGAKSLFW
ncbi:hypothetical protein Q7P36_000813 [Cladosporium allicinum]